jgi:hypothetical protein
MMMRTLVAIVPVFVALVTGFAQAPVSEQTESVRPRFEVASVKRNVAAGVMNVQSLPGRFIATGLPFKARITIAYRLQADKVIDRRATHAQLRRAQGSGLKVVQGLRP